MVRPVVADLDATMAVQPDLPGGPRGCMYVIFQRTIITIYYSQ